MGKRSKPWLNYTSDAPEREYPKKPKKKRQFKWALFWLVIGAHFGAHRLYLWQPKKALALLGLYFILLILGLILSLIFVELSGVSEGTVIGIIQFLPVLLIIAIELPGLKRRVQLANKKHLLL